MVNWTCERSLGKQLINLASLTLGPPLVMIVLNGPRCSTQNDEAGASDGIGQGVDGGWTHVAARVTPGQRGIQMDHPRLLLRVGRVSGRVAVGHLIQGDFVEASLADNPVEVNRNWFLVDY